MKKLDRYWISWHQPTEDYRPLTFPPDERILGWWCSGYDSDDVPTLCALVECYSLRESKEIIKSEWPEGRLRFNSARGAHYLPGDRFPIPEWSKLMKPLKPVPLR